MENIGQNGNDGLHYEEEFDEDHALDMVLNDMVKDMEVVEEEEVINTLKNSESQREFKKIRRVLQKGPSKWRVEFTDGTSGWVNKNQASKQF